MTEPIALEIEQPQAVAKPRWRKWLVGGLAVALIAGFAVKAIAATPQARLINAVNSWASAQQTDTAISVGVTPELLEALGMTDAAAAELGLVGVKSVDDAATALSQLRIRTLAERGADGAEAATWTTIEYGDSELLSLGLVDRVLYMRMVLESLSSTKPALADPVAVQGMIDSLGMLFAGQPWLQSLSEGDFVSVSLAKDTALGDAFDKALGESDGATDSAISSQALDELMTVLVDALKVSAAIEEDGSQDGKDKLLITIDGGKFANSSADGLVKYLKSFSGAGVAVPNDFKAEYIKALKGKELQLRVWLEGDRLAGFDFDLTSIVSAASDVAYLKPWSATLRLEFGDKQIVVPDNSDDATEAITALMGLMSGAATL